MEATAALAALLLMLWGTCPGDAIILQSSYDSSVSVSWQSTATKITFNVTMTNDSGVAMLIPISDHRSDLLFVSFFRDFVYDGGLCYGQEIYDSGQNIGPTIESSIRDGTFQYMSFYRVLDTLEPDDAVIQNFFIPFTFGKLVSDPNGVMDVNASRLDTVLVNLLDAKPNEDSSATTTFLDTESVTVALDNVTDVFWCSIFNWTLIEAIHVIKAEPIITPGNEDVVRSISLHSCDSSIDARDSFDCLTSGGKQMMQRCRTVIAVVNALGHAFVFPPDVGLLIEGATEPQYFMQKTHYGRTSTAGRLDNSTIRLTTTTDLRIHDAGVMQLGITEGLLIPPNVNNMLVSGYCSNTCFNRTTLNESGFNVISVALQSNQLTERMTLRHFSRSSGSLETAVVDQPFYPGLVTLYLNSTRRVMRDDVLQVVCSMDSTSRTHVTQGGQGGTHEECQAFVFYYPKTNLSQCQTKPLYTENHDDPIYALLNTTIGSFNWSTGENHGLASVVWTERTVLELQSRYYSGDTNEVCTGDTVFEEPWTIIELANSSLPMLTRASTSCPEMVTSDIFGPTTAATSRPVETSTTQSATTVTALADTTIMTQADATTSSYPVTVTHTQSLTTITAQFATAVVTQADTTATSQPVTVTLTQSFTTTTPQFATTVATQADTSAISQPAAATSTQSLATTTTQFAATAATQADTNSTFQPVTATPTQSLTTTTTQFATTVANQADTTATSQPVTATPTLTLSTTTTQFATTVADQANTTATSQPVTATPTLTLSTTTTQFATTVANQADTTTTSQPVTATPIQSIKTIQFATTVATQANTATTTRADALNTFQTGTTTPTQSVTIKSAQSAPTLTAQANNTKPTQSASTTPAQSGSTALSASLSVSSTYSISTAMTGTTTSQSLSGSTTVVSSGVTQTLTNEIVASTTASITTTTSTTTLKNSGQKFSSNTIAIALFICTLVMCVKKLS